MTVHHTIELVLRVDGKDVEMMALDGSRRASLIAERRSDGVVVAVFGVDDDASPPLWMLGGAEGYPGAHTVVFRKVHVGDDRLWRLIRAMGWLPEGS